MFNQREKLIILISCIICMVAPTIYTINHILFYNLNSQSSLNYLPQKYIFLELDFLKISGVIYFINLLIMLYFAIKNIKYNHKRRISNKFFKILVVLIILYSIIFFPITSAYILSHPNINSLVILWNIVHFIGIIFPLAFLFKVITEKQCS